jgi:uncharacterized protein YjiS (DUF1127 family)
MLQKQVHEPDPDVPQFRRRLKYLPGNVVQARRQRRQLQRMLKPCHRRFFPSHLETF